MSDEELEPYTATIKDRRTGEIVSAPQPRATGWGEGSEYFWSDGNFGCDCNRHIVFETAKGNDPDAEDCPCVSEDFPAGGRYVVLSIRLESGEEVYSEKEP